MENSANLEIEMKRYPKKTLAQLMGYSTVGNMLSFATVNLQFYYITIVKLPIELYMISLFVYTIWNMINDPLLGHLSDIYTRWTLKWGKRFPFIVAGILGTALSLILIFFVPIKPSENVMFTFIWLVLMMCVYDTFYSLGYINNISLFFDKVRHEEDRRAASGFLLIFAPIGMIIGIIFQPIIVEALGRESIFAWTVQAIFYAIIIVVIFLLFLGGIRESREMRERRVKIDSKRSEMNVNFLKLLKLAIKQRSYIANIIVWIAYNTMMAIIGSVISFYTVYILNLPLTAYILPMILMVVMSPLTIPIWLKLGKKWDTKILFSFGFLVMIVSLIPFLWNKTLIGAIILAIFLGVGLGCQGVMQLPILSDAIDEATSITQSRNEGMYSGIWIFFSRSSTAIQSLIVGSVLLLTGFNAEAPIQSDAAVLGIHLLMSIIPATIMIVGIILFWLIYDITPEKRKATQAKIKELDL